jgi:hypothetical protein
VERVLRGRPAVVDRQKLGINTGVGGGECRAEGEADQRSKAKRLLITSQYPVIPTCMVADRIKSG